MRMTHIAVNVTAEVCDCHVFEQVQLLNNPDIGWDFDTDNSSKKEGQRTRFPSLGWSEFNSGCEKIRLRAACGEYKVEGLFSYSCFFLALASSGKMCRTELAAFLYDLAKKSFFTFLKSRQRLRDRSLPQFIKTSSIHALLQDEHDSCIMTVSVQDWSSSSSLMITLHKTLATYKRTNAYWVAWALW